MGRALFVLLGIVLIGLPGGTAAAEESGEKLAQALTQQEAWLSSSDQAGGWNRFLMTDALRSELARGDDADRRTVARIVGRYGAGLPALKLKRFAATRHHLNQWADHLAVPMTVRWAEQLAAASSSAPPIDAATIERARLELVDSAKALNAMLGSANAATQQGWKTFLRWSDLESQMTTSSPNWKALEGVGAQFFNGHRGLEYPEFVRVRESIRKYLYLGTMGENGKGQKSIKANMQALSQALEKYNQNPSTKAAGDVATLLDWLTQLERVPDLAKQIRAAHAMPNIKIRVAEGLLQRRFSRDVETPMTVNEMILGTHVRGNAVTTGNVTTDIVPNDKVARIDIVFRGATRTRSVGRQSPVTVRSTSSTVLEARKSLYVYPSKVTANPSKATGKTSTTIHSITPDNKLGRRFIGKIAWSRANQQKPQTEAIASRRAERRLERQIDEESQELLTRAQQALREQLRGPINRRGLIPEKIQTRSTDTHVIASFTQANKAQFGATTAPPMFCPHDDVVAQIHESAINNTAEKAIAGLTLTDERIAELSKEVTGSIPEGLQIKDDEPPWSISFDWKQPMTVQFDDQQMTIAIRGRRFTSGERELNKVMEMSATYTMETLESGVLMKRQGEVEVTFPTNREGQTLGARERVFRTLMQGKFSEVFKPEIKGDGFSLPGRFENLGRIRLNDLSTENGWLSLGWK